MIQMELGLAGPGTLRYELMAYLGSECCDGLADGTLDDYRERISWLVRAFGEWTRLEAITFARLQQVLNTHGPRGHGLRNVTIKRRFVLLRAAMKYAANRGVIRKDQVPDLPKLRDDGERRRGLHTLTQFSAFRLALPERRFRFFADLAFYTGHHRLDLFTTERWMLDPDRPFLDEDGTTVLARGMWLRRNHKNKRCEPIWFPMEPTFRELVVDYYGHAGNALAPTSLVTGKLWNLTRTFHAACDRAEVPRVAPIDFRRSLASRLLAEGYTHEYVRQVLGHEGNVSDEGRARRPTILTRHYAVANPALIKAALARRPG